MTYQRDRQKLRDIYERARKALESMPRRKNQREKSPPARYVITEDKPRRFSTAMRRPVQRTKVVKVVPERDRPRRNKQNKNTSNHQQKKETVVLLQRRRPQFDRQDVRFGSRANGHRQRIVVIKEERRQRGRQQHVGSRRVQAKSIKKVLRTYNTQKGNKKQLNNTNSNSKNKNKKFGKNKAQKKIKSGKATVASLDAALDKYRGIKGANGSNKTSIADLDAQLDSYKR